MLEINIKIEQFNEGSAQAIILEEKRSNLQEHTELEYRAYKNLCSMLHLQVLATSGLRSGDMCQRNGCDGVIKEINGYSSMIAYCDKCEWEQT